MAKIFKIKMYVADPNDKLENEEALVSELGYYLEDLYVHATRVEMRSFEWGDDIAINQLNATDEDHEVYFKQ